MQTVLLFGPYNPEDLVMLEVSVVSRDFFLAFVRPHRWIPLQNFRILEQKSFADNYSPFGLLISLSWNWTLHHELLSYMWLPIMNWMVLANTYYHISHKVRHTQEYSIIKWRWYIWDQARAVPEGTSKLCEEVVQMVMVPILPHYFLSSACTHVLLVSFLWPTDREREDEDLFSRQFYTTCRNTPESG